MSESITRTVERGHETYLVSEQVRGWVLPRREAAGSVLRRTSRKGRAPRGRTVDRCASEHGNDRPQRLGRMPHHHAGQSRRRPRRGGGPADDGSVLRGRGANAGDDHRRRSDDRGNPGDRVRGARGGQKDGCGRGRPRGARAQRAPTAAPPSPRESRAHLLRPNDAFALRIVARVVRGSKEQAAQLPNLGKRRCQEARITNR